uniref:Uncharacterized protein n=1 Tax=Rhizophora mucronata TaxID=61149 RepID=A0A2P2QDB9_RHIMU
MEFVHAGRLNLCLLLFGGLFHFVTIVRINCGIFQLN